MTGARLAAGILTLGPVGQYSRRPGIMAILLLAACFTLVPPPLLSRVALTGALVLAVGWARIATTPGALQGRPAVAERAAGVWGALIPVPETWPGFLAALAGYAALVELPVAGSSILDRLPLARSGARVGIATLLGLGWGIVVRLLLGGS